MKEQTENGLNKITNVVFKYQLIGIACMSIYPFYKAINDKDTGWIPYAILPLGIAYFGIRYINQSKRVSQLESENSRLKNSLESRVE